MKLEFYSVDELDHFLDWAYGMSVRVRAMRAEPVVPGASGGIQPCTGEVAFDTPPAGGSVGGHSVFTAGDGSPADQEAKDLQIGPYDPAFAATQPSDDAKPSVNPEPVKRKRRTKAEIEADDKAAAETAAAVFNSKEPAEASETLAGASTAPEGANPFAAAEPAAETPATPAGDVEAADTTVTPFQHLTRAREFIAKHGMPKYNESFAKAGLDANVMGYSAYQRALHMDALAALEAA